MCDPQRGIVLIFSSKLFDAVLHIPNLNADVGLIVDVTHIRSWRVT